MTNMRKPLLLSILFLGCLLTASAQLLNIDPQFNTGNGTDGEIHASLIQPDGKLIIVGSFNSYNSNTAYSIARINTDGSIDGTFQANVGTTFQSSTIHDVGIDSNNELLVVGDFTGYVKRINSDGTLDAFVLSGSGLDATVTAIAVQSDDKIIVGGQFETFNTVTDRDKIARINTDGSLDTGFDPGTGFNPGSFAPINDIEIQGDGKVLVGGQFTSYNGVSNNYLIRLNTDGTEDNAFTTATSGYVEDILIQSDDRILIAGANQVSSNGRILRLDADGVIGDIDLFDSGRQLSVATNTNGDIFVGSYTGLLVLDASDGSNITSTYTLAPEFGVSPKINTLGFKGFNNLYVAGTFTSFNGFGVNNITQLNDCNGIELAEVSNSVISVCEGSDVAFVVEATGAGISYQWQKVEASGIYTDLTDGAMFSGTTTASLLPVNVSSTQDEDQFRCVVTDGVCTLTSFNFTLDVLLQQSITGQPVDATVCSSESASFTVIYDGDFGEFQWQVDDGSGGGFVDLTDDGIHSNVNGNTMTISGATNDMNANKYRFVMGLCNQVISNEVTLTVNSLPEITEVDERPGICASGDASFSVTASGEGTLSYQWQYRQAGGTIYADLTDGGIYSGTTSSMLTLTSVDETFSDNYITESDGTKYAQYRCKVTANSCEVISTAVKLLSIYDTPTITTDPEDVSVCDQGQGASQVQFSVITDISVGGYQWQVDDGSGGGFVDLEDGGIYSSTSGSTMSITGATSGMSGYKYRALVGNCEPQVVSAEATLTVNDLPEATYTAVRQVCEGSDASYTITAEGDNLLYQWQVGSGSTFVDLADDQIYSGTSSNSLAIESPLVSLDGTNYRCVITVGDCEKIITVSALDVIAEPTLPNDPVDQTACVDDLVSFSVSTASGFNSSIHNYQWQEDFGGLGVFTDIVDNEDYSGANGISLTVKASQIRNGNQYRLTIQGCESTITTEPATLAVETVPFITNSTTGLQEICVGGSASFGVEATGSNLAYQWYYEDSDGTVFSVGDGGSFSGGTTDSLKVTNALAAFDGYTFFCVVSGSCEPADTSLEAQLLVDQVAIDNDGFVIINGASVNSTNICAGDNLLMSVTASGESPTYQWQLNGVDIVDGDGVSGATTSTLNLEGLTSGNNGAYVCVVGGECESKESIALNLNVISIEKPVISQQTSGSSTILSVNIGGEQIEWFKDGETFTSGSSSIEVSDPGSYTVIVTTQGCSSEESDPVVVSVALGLSFAPNLTLYPNPVLSSINLNIPNSALSEYQYHIIDMTGRTFSSGELIEKIDVDYLKSGFYLLVIGNNTEKISLKFFKD